MKYIMLSMAVVIISISHVWADPLTVVYTANSEGKLMACGCPGDPYGGLGERVSMIQALREERGQFLLVDAGNMISLFGDTVARSATVIELMNRMHYDVAGIGKYDLYNGVGTAASMAAKASFPIVSASMIGSDGDMLFVPWSRVEIAGVSVAVVSVADSVNSYVYSPGHQYHYTVRSVDAALSHTLAEIPASVDYIIVLSHLDASDNQALIEQYPRIDLIVQAWGNDMLETPISTANGAIVSPGSRGRMVGAVTIDHRDGSVVLSGAELLPVLGYILPEDVESEINESYGRTSSTR